MNTFRTTLLLSMVAFALVVAACGSDDTATIEVTVDTSLTDATTAETSTTTAAAATTVEAAADDQVLVVVYAHPDDELTISPLLGHYAKQGVEVYVVSVTSGEQGERATDLPAGDELAAAREAELTAAAAAYGINEPIFFRDADGEQDSLSDSEIADLKARLRAVFEDVGADVVITFGPDGFTGHADHIAVGAITTELVEEWYAEADRSAAPGKVYYSMFPASRYEMLPAGQQFVPVDDDEATTIVDAGDGLAEAEAAVLAYESQFSAEEMQQVQCLIRDLTEGRVYLRCVLVKDGEPVSGETDIFAS